jgi:hypothetical protein
MAKPLPYAVCRVYAVREGGHWVLANALGQLTRQWRRTEIGPITFVYPPAHHFDRARARRSVTFVDSVASAFGAGRPKAIEFYVADSQEGMLRLLGLDVVPNHTPGRLQMRNFSRSEVNQGVASTTSSAHDLWKEAPADAEKALREEDEEAA